jgi:hypothetical protein
MVARQFPQGPELNTFLPKGDFRGPEVHQIPMDRPTTLTEHVIVYDASGARLYGIRLTRIYGKKTAAPASRMKKQWKKETIKMKKIFSGQHRFTHLYEVYNDWKELERLQESLESFTEVMNAFISAEKLSDDEDVRETPIIKDDQCHLSHGTVTGKEQKRTKVTGKEHE